MSSENHKTGLQLRSLLKSSGELEVSLANVPTSEPKDDEIVVRVEATPINPSDLGLLFGPADMAAAKFSGTQEAPVVTAQMPAAALKGMAARLDESMPVGNEGAGVVVKAGASDAAQALMGKTVSMIGGAMYAQYRVVRAKDVMALPEGTTAADGASWFVNPLTVARHDRDHAARGSQGAGAHRRRVEPRADAQQDLPEGRYRPRQHRAQPGAGGYPAQDRRQTCRRIHPRQASWTI